MSRFLLVPGTLRAWLSWWLPPGLKLWLRKLQMVGYRPFERDGTFYANSPKDKLEEREIHRRLLEVDQLSHVYRFEAKHPYGLSKVRVFFPLLDRLVAERPRLVVLDVGCGKGLILNHVKKRYPMARCYGFDLSFEGLVLAERHTPSRYFQADAEDIPLCSECADVVLQISTIHHFFRFPKRILRETYRILRPNGFMLIVDPNVSSETLGIHYRVQKIRKHTRAILNLLDELLRPVEDPLVVPAEVPVHPQDSCTEGAIPLSVLEQELTATGFVVVERGFMNHTRFDARRYYFGWDIAETIDNYLSKVAPNAATQVYLVAQRNGRSHRPSNISGRL